MSCAVSMSPTLASTVRRQSSRDASQNEARVQFFATHILQCERTATGLVRQSGRHRVHATRSCARPGTARRRRAASGPAADWQQQEPAHRSAIWTQPGLHVREGHARPDIGARIAHAPKRQLHIVRVAGCSRRPCSRLIENYCMRCGLVVAFRGPMGWLPDRLPAVAVWL